MKKATLILILAALVFPAVVFPSRVSASAAQEGTKAVFSDVEGKEWILSEVRAAGKTVSINRKQLEAGNMAGAFSISFQKDSASNGGRLGGMGAPNRYFAGYTPGAGKALSITPIASTLMVAIIEPEGLKEREYFDYLAKVTRWELRDSKLELYSSNAANAEAVLVFSRK